MEIREMVDAVNQRVTDIHEEIYGHEVNPGLRGRMTKVETGFDRIEQRFDEMRLLLDGDGKNPGLKGEMAVLKEQAKTSAWYSKAILGALLTLVFTLVLNFLSGCVDLTPPGLTSTPIPTAPTVTPAETAEPTRTATATATSTPTPSATAGPPINLLANPSFEGEYHDGPGGRIAEGWDPFYCAPPYTSSLCYAPLDWTPYEPYLFIGEYNAAREANRVHDGESAQHLFSPNKLTDSGVTQDVYGLVVGEYYWLSFYGQMWLADGQHRVVLPDGTVVWRDEPCVRRDSTNACIEWGSDTNHSDRATEGDFEAGWMVAGVGSCESNAFDEEGVVWGRPYGSFDGLFDQFGEVSVGFQAWDDCARVFLRAWNKFAKGHSDFYFDEAMLVRATFDQPTPEPTPTQIGPIETPAPGVTPTPPPTVTPTPAPRPNDPAIQELADGAQYTPYGNWHVREGHSVTALSIGGLVPNVPVDAFAVWSGGDGSLWVCLDPEWTWTANPDFYINVLVCDTWTAWRFGGTELGTLE